MLTSRSGPALGAARRTLVTMAAVLLTFASALAIEHAAHLHTDVVVLAVVMALTLSRTSPAEGAAELGRRVVTLPLVAVAAGQVGRLMLRDPVLGDALFVAGLSLAVWLRRFGRTVSRFGALISLPFIALLVVPVPVSAGTAEGLWPALLAVTAFAWVTACTGVGRRVGWLAAPAAHGPTTVRSGPRRPARGRLLPSTRMALQLGAALGASLLVGHWLYPRHWPWLVLSCYLVCSGNRGRGDVLHKAVLRLLGAGLGTASATLLAGRFPAGDRTAIVLLFVILGLALWLRERSYGFWAAGVTAALALLNGYYGVSGSGELAQRLGGVALGALIGVAVSWWLLPVRSGDVFRRRTADALAALSDYLGALRADAGAASAAARAFHHRVGELEQVLPAFRFHQQTVARLGDRRDRHACDVILALADVRSALGGLPPASQVAAAGPLSRRELGALATQVGSIRRRLAAAPVTRDLAAPQQATGADGSALAEVAAAINRLDAVLTSSLWRRHGSAKSAESAPAPDRATGAPVRSPRG